MNSAIFPKSARLCKTPEFKHVFARKYSVVDSILIVFAVPNGLTWNRLGISVSKKIGNAVVRNRWKRLIREAFRKNRTDFTTCFDLVVVPQRNIEIPSAEEIEKSLRNLVAKISCRAHFQNVSVPVSLQ